MSVRHLAVVGTGVIGAGWAALGLARGLDVTAHDPAAGAEQRLREVQQLRRDRAAASLAANDHTVDALLQVLGHVNRFDLPLPLGGRGAGDPSFPITTGTLIIIITAHQ